MGLDVTVYSDETCDCEITSMRIGSIEAVAKLRASIEEKLPAAEILLTKVLYSGSHAGDILEKDTIVKAQVEMSTLSFLCDSDKSLKDFVSEFGAILETAIRCRRPIIFT